MIKTILSDYNKIIENAIDEFLPPAESNYKVLNEAMRYSLLLGGKRIRPALLLEFYKVCGGQGDNAVPFAVAIEMIHTYSLIHDDLPCMDNDDMRRGKLSNHKVFGEDIALLAGDGLLTHAFYTASKTDGIPAERVVKAINELAYFAGCYGMVGGQVIDLKSEGKSIDAALIEELNLLKTGGLLRASAKIGAILAGADNDKIKAADNFSVNIGLAFQIVDDILDSCGDSSALGKPTGSDEKNGKSTFVALYGVEKCREMVTELTDNALVCLEAFEGDTEFLKGLAMYLAERDR